MMNLTSAIRVTFALAATTICFGALAGPFDVCVEEFYENVQPCVGPCNVNPSQCQISYITDLHCEFGGGGCTMSPFQWVNQPFDKFHCAPGSSGSCICGTGQVIETGVLPRWARTCSG